MSEPTSTIEEIAVETLICALAWEPGVRLIGNVRARDLARLAASVVGTCPCCASEAWCNIDCAVCQLGNELREEGNQS